MPRIAVIGAGASGLPAIKTCLEEGAEVVCFERTGEMGGLWNFRDHQDKDQGTVMRTTIINTSKEMMAYSDFPPPAHMANFMHNSVLKDYLDSYAAQFDLTRHVRFGTEVTRIYKAPDYVKTGELVVRSRPYCPQSVANFKTKIGKEDTANSDSSLSADETEEMFSGVLVCTGHHGTPSYPTIPGLEAFPGRVRHSQEIRDPATLKETRVLLVGFGNSSIDAAVEFARDSSNKLGWDLASRYVEHSLNQRVDHDMYGIRPKHGFFNAHPTVNDLLPSYLCAGQIKMKGDVESVKGSRVHFTDGTSEEVDEIILSTGYKFHMPFLDKDLFQSEGNRVSLYKFVFNPELPRESLAFIGFIQPIGAVQPISEIQARWAVRVMLAKAQLPPAAEMRRDIAAKAKAMEERYFRSPKHTVQVEYVLYMDEVSRLIGACPFRLSTLLTDPKLWLSLLFGPCDPYSYRIFGPHAWVGARAASLSVLDRVKAPFQANPDAERKAPLGRDIRVGYANILTPAFGGKLTSIGLLSVFGVVGFGALGWTTPAAVALVVALLIVVLTFDLTYDIATLQ